MKIYIIIIQWLLRIGLVSPNLGPFGWIVLPIEWFVLLMGEGLLYFCVSN